MALFLSFSSSCCWSDFPGLCLNCFSLDLKTSFAGLFLGRQINHHTPFVVTAFETHMMWSVLGTTVSTGRQSWRCERMMRTTVGGV
jgi:hypothetical protein